MMIVSRAMTSNMTPRPDTGARPRPFAVRLGGAVAVVTALTLGQACPAAADHLSYTLSGGGHIRTLLTSLYAGGIQLQPGVGHDPHFASSSIQQLSALNEALTGSLGHVTVGSVVGNFVFDLERGVAVATDGSHGPLVAERAATLGAKKLDIGFSYTHINYTTFDGQDLGKLKLLFKHQDVNNDGCLGCTPGTQFEKDTISVRLNLKIEQDFFNFSGTYGITDRWDVGVILPFVRILVSADALATINRNSGAVSVIVHNFPGPIHDTQHSMASSEAFGLGDLALRTKYNFVKDEELWPDLSVVTQVKVPTGDPKNLLGSGSTDLLGMLIASKRFGPVTPHTNLGWEWNTDKYRQSNLRYILGFDALTVRSLTLAMDLVGRYKPEGNGIGDNTLDGAVGVRWNPTKSVILNFNVQVPLNKREGLRPDYILSTGFEYTFF
jgi:hypothetical protein